MFIDIWVDFPFPPPGREDFAAPVHTKLLVCGPLLRAPDTLQFLVRPFKKNRKSLCKYFIYFIHRAGM